MTCRNLLAKGTINGIFAGNVHPDCFLKAALISNRNDAVLQVVVRNIKNSVLYLSI